MLFLCWRWQWIVLSRLSRFRKKAGDAKLRFYHSFVKGLKRVQLCDSRRLRKKPQDAQDYVTELFDMFDAHFWGWKGMEFGLPKAVLPRSLIVRAEGSQPTGPRQKNSRSTLKSPTYARCRTPTQTPAKTENRREDPNSNAKTSRRPPFWKPFQPHFREQKENVRLFFLLLLRPISLRLGPDSERSGRKACKKYETLWLHKRGKPWKKQKNRKKHGNSDDTQISPARFAFRQHKKRRNNT